MNDRTMHCFLCNGTPATNRAVVELENANTHHAVNTLVCDDCTDHERVVA